MVKGTKLTKLKPGDKAEYRDEAYKVETVKMVSIDGN